MEKEAVCGLRCSELFAKYDPDSSSLKMSGDLFTEGLELSLKIWPQSGLMLNGKLYQLHSFAHRIRETEGLFWPSPLASDGKNIDSLSERKRKTMHLESFVKVRFGINE